MPLSNEQRQHIVEALAQRGAPNLCPVCQLQKLDVVNTYAGLFLKDSLAPLEIPGDEVMTVALTRCRNCGFLMMHDLTALGLA